jgi:hypothetical protein
MAAAIAQGDLNRVMTLTTKNFDFGELLSTVDNILKYIG